MRQGAQRVAVTDAAGKRLGGVKGVKVSNRSNNKNNDYI